VLSLAQHPSALEDNIPIFGVNNRLAQLRIGMLAYKFNAEALACL